MERKDEKEGFLAGIRILDLADEKASFCSKLLADLGANVIKIEKPGGDPSRWIGPFWKNSANEERSLSFFYNNTNKQGITLDLKRSEGRDIFRSLIESSDVVVETFAPGYLKELGLDFEALSAINHRIILVSVSGFGQTGGRKKYKSCDLVASAFGGQMYVSGSPSTPPLKPFGEQTYYTSSLYAAIGILLALRKRAQNGKGEHIDISMQEAVASTVEHVLIRYFYEQIVQKRQGSLHWDNSFYIFQCKDGSICLTLFQQWETLVEWMASEGMAEDLVDKKWNDETYRLKNLDHIIEVLQRWVKTHTTEELFGLGQLMRFPWAPVYSPKSVLKSSQLKARNFFIDINHPEINSSIRYPGLPFTFSRLSSTQWRRAPLIGEDNVHIYRKKLGISAKTLKRLSSLNTI